jgi:hypothetical protein
MMNEIKIANVEKKEKPVGSFESAAAKIKEILENNGDGEINLSEEEEQSIIADLLDLRFRQGIDTMALEKMLFARILKDEKNSKIKFWLASLVALAGLFSDTEEELKEQLIYNDGHQDFYQKVLNYRNKFTEYLKMAEMERK